MKNILVVLTVFIIFTGCEKIDLGKPLSISLNNKYRVDNTLSFTIDSLKDYRCPKDVVCVWGGDVELFFNIRQSTLNIDTVIYLNTHDNNPFSLGGYTWEILDVDPWLNSGQKANPDQYRVKMIITDN